MSWPFGDLRPFSFDAILCDPPWAYEMYSDKGYGKSPEAHYATMSDGELRSLPVGHLAAPGCLLVMWAVFPRLDFAIDLLKHWGFAFKTGGAWHKKTAGGKTAFGTGYILRSAAEPFIVGTIGRPAYASRSIRNLIEAPAREHSRKPDEMRRMVEQLMPAGARLAVARPPGVGQRDRQIRRDSMSYDWRQDAIASWAYAIKKLRQRWLLSGGEPATEEEFAEVYYWRAGP